MQEIGASWRDCGEDRLQIADVAETPSIGQRTARIHGAGDGVCKVVPGVVDTADALAFGGAPVMSPPTAHDVEVLQSQSGRIELGVTRSAGARLGVHRQQVANGLGATYVRSTAGRPRRSMAGHQMRHISTAKDRDVDGRWR